MGREGAGLWHLQGVGPSQERQYQSKNEQFREKVGRRNSRSKDFLGVTVEQRGGGGGGWKGCEEARGWS